MAASLLSRGVITSPARSSTSFRSRSEILSLDRTLIGSSLAASPNLIILDCLHCPHLEPSCPMAPMLQILRVLLLKVAHELRQGAQVEAKRRIDYSNGIWNGHVVEVCWSRRDNAVRQALFNVIPVAPKIVCLPPSAVGETTDGVSDCGQQIQEGWDQPEVCNRTVTQIKLVVSGGSVRNGGNQLRLLGRHVLDKIPPTVGLKLAQLLAETTRLSRMGRSELDLCRSVH